MSEKPAREKTGRERRNPKKHWMLFFMRIVLGGLFAFAASTKILAPAALADAIGKFEMVPDAVLMEAAVILIWFEMICGVFMLLGLWTRAATIVICGMLAVFLAGMIAAVVRGLDISCGCFGSFFETDVGWKSILRTIVLLSFSLLLLYYGSWKYSLDLVVKVNRRIKAGLPGWRTD